jgi:hypothetical protein
LKETVKIPPLPFGERMKKLMTPLLLLVCIYHLRPPVPEPHTQPPTKSKKILVYIKVTGKDATISAAPFKSNGFVNAEGEVLPKVKILQEPSGLNCQHLGHLGGSRNLSIKNCICINCTYDKDKGTPPIKALSTSWTLQKLIKMRTTRPTFFVVLVSRSSVWKNIPNSMYQTLKETIIKNER